MFYHLFRLCSVPSTPSPNVYPPITQYHIAAKLNKKKKEKKRRRRKKSENAGKSYRTILTKLDFSVTYFLLLRTWKWLRVRVAVRCVCVLSFPILWTHHVQFIRKADTDNNSRQFINSWGEKNTRTWTSREREKKNIYFGFSKRGSAQTAYIFFHFSFFTHLLFFVLFLLCASCFVPVCIVGWIFSIFARLELSLAFMPCLFWIKRGPQLRQSSLIGEYERFRRQFNMQ